MKKEVSKKVSKKVSEAVASLALAETSGMVNSACAFFMYQPEMPEGAEELQK